MPDADLINSPPHYADRRIEVIDIITDNIAHAPDPIAGFMQGQVLKYTCRMWGKDKPLTNALKARWYLNRLIEHLENIA